MGFAIAMAVFLAANILLGFISQRIGFADSADYYLAGKGVNLTLQGLTTFATISSGFTMMGAVGSIYGHGLAFLWLGWIWSTIYTLWWVFYQPRVWFFSRQVPIQTIGDLARDYFQFKDIQTYIVGIISVLAQIGYIVAQLMAVGLLFNVLSGISVTAGVLISLVVVIAYTYIGGLRAVIWTDALQCAIFLIVAIGSFALFLPLATQAGFPGVLLNMPEHLTLPGALGTWTPVYAITYAFAWGMCYMGLPMFFTRAITPRSERDCRRGVGIGNGLTNIVCWFLMPIVGLLLLVIYPAMNVSLDMVPATAIFQTFPWLGIVYGVAVAAACLSTANSALIATSNVFYKDFYERIRRHNITQEEEVKFSRIFVLVVGGICAVAAALQPDSIVSLVGISAFLAGILFWCFIAPPCFHKLAWVTPTASIIAAIVGTIFASIFVLGKVPAPFGVHGAVAGWLITMVLLFVISPLTKKVPMNSQQRYHAQYIPQYFKHVADNAKEHPQTVGESQVSV
ncbi:Na+/proline symporter [Desulfotomaculum arcticum]|uniref:Na+/proline symporter n=1 Tax=Desulfotruncus arcticus DSM 17038 TaxID=1121424 RepID=A0A1I2XW07_9FIRM|nr:sodium:solute symporter family protein [Desulfotruncus arcticus]SFH17257.1 Na+/proline symporter [Desulfotomaculum arcticum] [Desulfotruncus arcticus DSM 17038]